MNQAIVESVRVHTRNLARRHGIKYQSDVSIYQQHGCIDPLSSNDAHKLMIILTPREHLDSYWFEIIITGESVHVQSLVHAAHEIKPIQVKLSNPACWDMLDRFILGAIEEAQSVGP